MKRLLYLAMILLTVIPMCCKGEGMMDKEDQQSFLKNIQMKSWVWDNASHGITCFDVNEYGDIVVGMKESDDRCLVSIYDKTGKWLWGYSFISSGRYYLEWDSRETINIYWVRSSVKGTFDSQANCLKLNEYTLDSSMNERFLRLGASERLVDNTKYYLDANLGFLSSLALTYSRVVCSTPEGQEMVVIDMKGGNIGGIIFLCILVIFVIIAISISIKRYI